MAYQKLKKILKNTTIVWFIRNTLQSDYNMILIILIIPSMYFNGTTPIKNSVLYLTENTLNLKLRKNVNNNDNVQNKKHVHCADSNFKITLNATKFLISI